MYYNVLVNLLTGQDKEETQNCKKWTNLVSYRWGVSCRCWFPQKLRTDIKLQLVAQSEINFQRKREGDLSGSPPSSHPTKLVIYMNSLLNHKADSTSNKLVQLRGCCASRQSDWWAERLINSAPQEKRWGKRAVQGWRRGGSGITERTLRSLW